MALCAFEVTLAEESLLFAGFRKLQCFDVCSYPSRGPGVGAQRGSCPWCEMIFSRGQVGVEGGLPARPHCLSKQWYIEDLPVCAGRIVHPTMLVQRQQQDRRALPLAQLHLPCQACQEPHSLVSGLGPATWCHPSQMRCQSHPCPCYRRPEGCNQLHSLMQGRYRIGAALWIL